MEADASAIRAEDLFDAATIGGADALGRPDLGRLMPGAMADIVVHDLSNDRIGQVIDPSGTNLRVGRFEGPDYLDVDNCVGGCFLYRRKHRLCYLCR